MTILITGAAGFIGFHLASHFLENGDEVIGFDAFTPYYDVDLKRRRIDQLSNFENFKIIEGDLSDAELVKTVIETYTPSSVFHLAAQAGVRYSIENPRAYVETNLEGSFNLFEALKSAPPRHTLIASTSSIYGGNVQQPATELDPTDSPASLYAATKRGVEALSHSYSHLYDLPTTCFRFFTVYGPWGRPDMALFKFVKSILQGQEIEIYGHGDMSRDFTYIDDLIKSITLVEQKIPQTGKPISSRDSVSPIAPWRVVNLAGGSPKTLMDFVNSIEKSLGLKAKKKLLPMQPGDVKSTHADSTLLEQLTGFKPATELQSGVDSFVHWYKEIFNHSVQETDCGRSAK